MLKSISDPEQNHYNLHAYTPSRQNIESLAECLNGIRQCTRNTHKSAENIRKTARVLNSLTSPATDHSARLANAARNLQKVQNEVSRATDMMERVEECSPAIGSLVVKTKDLQVVVMKRRKKEERAQYFGGNSKDGVVEGKEEDYDTDREIEEEMMIKRMAEGREERSGKNASGKSLMDGFEVIDTVRGTKNTVTKAIFDGTKFVGKEIEKMAKGVTKGISTTVNILTLQFDAQADSDMIAEFHQVAFSGPLTPTSLNTVTGSGVSLDVIEEGKNMMDELKEAYLFFHSNKQVCNSSIRMAAIQRLYNHGMKAFCRLINIRLSECGQAVRLKKRSVQNEGKSVSFIGQETAEETRQRLTTALNNRTLMQSVSEYEEHIPLNKDEIYELRLMFGCLVSKQDSSGLPSLPDDLSNLKISSGSNERHTKIFDTDFKTGFLHLDVYAKARKFQAYGSLESYYKRLSNERKIEVSRDESLDLSHLEARDIVRFVEHAMVVITGEQEIFKIIVAPMGVRGFEDGVLTRKYRDALSSSFSHIAACVVERLIHALEYIFYKQAKASMASDTKLLKLAKASMASGAKLLGSTVTSFIPVAASASTAGLRVLDGVRILGPTLAKLCDMTDVGKGFDKTESSKLVSSFCIELHRLTVKATAKAMENLINVIIDDPLYSPHRPSNAGIANISFEVVRAIKSISTYTSAYKSVAKRRSLPWDPKTGNDAGSFDMFVKWIISKLCRNLEEKAKSYMKDLSHLVQNLQPKDAGFISQGKCYLFIVVNTNYILQSFKPRKRTLKKSTSFNDDDEHKITSPWFKEKVGNLMERDKEAYLDIWGSLVVHMTPVEINVNDKERHRQIKARFGGFVEEYEKLYFTHNRLQIEDDALRRDIRVSIREKFLNQYTTFFDTYSNVPFSKKRMNEYLKYKPAKIESMINELFSCSTST